MCVQKRWELLWGKKFLENNAHAIEQRFEKSKKICIDQEKESVKPRHRPVDHSIDQEKKGLVIFLLYSHLCMYKSLGFLKLLGQIQWLFKD